MHSLAYVVFPRAAPGRWSFGVVLIGLFSAGCSDDSDDAVVSGTRGASETSEAGTETGGNGASSWSSGDATGLTATGMDEATSSESSGGASASTEASAGATSEASESSTQGDGSTSAAGDESDSGGEQTGDPSSPCAVDEDCLLVNDCCTCGAISIHAAPAESCDIECFAPACTSVGTERLAPVCRFGRCELEARCDGTGAEGQPPVCDDGRLPEVVDYEYTGNCVQQAYCDYVQSCDACSNEQTCVTETTFFNRYRCESLPQECREDLTCECFNPCTVGSAGGCAVGPDGTLSCFCAGC